MTNPFQKIMMATSIVYMVLGLILIIWPDQARQIICYLLGAAALLYGLYRIIDYFARKQHSEGGVQIGVALGIACVVLGLFLLFKANTVVAVLAGVIGVAVVIDSILRLQIALNLRRVTAAGWLALFITALVTLVFGILLLFNPFNAVKVATIVAGAALLVDGAFTLWGLIKTRSIRDRRTVIIK
ncbi:MAG: DUF308 domain-containing protein [Clostridiaceae bacterium]